MNRSLLLLAIFMVLIGAGSGFYALTILGLIMLVPALMAPSRAPPGRVPATPKHESRWAGVSTRPQPTTPAMPPETRLEMQPETKLQYYVMTPSQQQTGTFQPYSPALFPNSIFPSLSSYVNVPPQQAEAAAKKPSERDELIETGAMLALMKLLLG